MFDPIVLVACLLLVTFLASVLATSAPAEQPPATEAVALLEVTAQPSQATPATATPTVAISVLLPTTTAPAAADNLAAAPLPLPSPTSVPPESVAPLRTDSAEIGAPVDLPLGDFMTPTPLPPPPLPTPIAATAARVPILMYHYTSEPPADADIYRRDLSVSPEALRAQLTYLRDNGYTAISLYDLARGLAGQLPLPPNPVVLTFDDGYRDNYAVAFPLLREFGMSGTFFIVTDFVESGNENYMTWAMVREMADAGMAMEIHTRTHPDLRELERDEVVDQIFGAQQKLAEQTGRLPRFLAYPSGHYTDQALEIVRELDLWGAVTTQHGSYQSYGGRFELKRLRIRYTTDVAQFAALLRGEP